MTTNVHKALLTLTLALTAAAACRETRTPTEATAAPATPAREEARPAPKGWGLRVRTAARTFLVSPDGQPARELPHAAHAGELSPDKSRLLAVRFEDGDFEIYVSGADGRGARRLTRREMFDGEAHWSPDGKRIIFASSRAGSWQVYEMDADGRNARRVSGEGERASKPQYTAEGRASYLVEKGARADGKTVPLYDLVVREGDASRVVAAGQPLAGFAWSPRGATVAYGLLGEGGRLVILDAATGARRELASADIEPRLGGHVARVIRWRPDGGALAVQLEFTGGREEGSAAESFGDRHIFVIPLDGKPSWFEAEPGAQFEWVPLD